MLHLTMSFTTANLPFPSGGLINSGSPRGIPVLLTPGGDVSKCATLAAGLPVIVSFQPAVPMADFTAAGWVGFSVEELY